MLYGYLPILIILIGLAIAVVIIIRKFPQLKVLDVDELPEEQDRKKKDKLLEEKFYRAMSPLKKRGIGWGRKFLERMKVFQEDFRGYVNRIADSYREEHGKVHKKKQKSKTPAERKKEVARLVEEADELRHKNDLVHAEEKYIAAIGIAPRSISAYKGLGKVYFAQEKFDDARETFTYLAKLAKSDDIVHAFLGRIAKAKEKWEESVKHYKRAIELNGGLAKRHIDIAKVYIELDKKREAVAAYRRAFELEPKNPAVLDQIIEFAFDVKDKVLAREMIKRLQEVNPENKKLEQFKKDLQKL